MTQQLARAIDLLQERKPGLLRYNPSSGHFVPPVLFQPFTNPSVLCYDTIVLEVQTILGRDERMPEDSYTQLNDFLVNLFNDILRIEEHCLSSNEFKTSSIKGDSHHWKRCATPPKPVGTTGPAPSPKHWGHRRHVDGGGQHLGDAKVTWSGGGTSGDKRVVRPFQSNPLRSTWIHSHFHHEDGRLDH